MKILLVTWLFLMNSFANTESYSITKSFNDSISGLKIIKHKSEKKGDYIYIISDLYVNKKVSIYKLNGKKVFSKTTNGSPIYLSKFTKGKYIIKISEEGKTVFKSLEI